MLSSLKVGIVVLNFNGEKCLLPCLESLSALEYSEKFVVVVDNHSEDGSIEMARERFKEHRYILNSENQGFSRGMNLGIRAALKEGAEWVWIFNNDALAAPDSLNLLLAAAAHRERVGMLSPLIIDKETNEVWFAEGKINFFRMRTEHVLPRPSLFSQEAYPSEFLTGCALLINKRVFESVGFLDEDFFLYYEDADLSSRVWSAGFQCLVVPGAKVFHRENSRLNPRKVYFLVYSGLLFFHKHSGFFMKPYLWAYATIRRAKNIIDSLFQKKEAQHVRQAMIDFYHDH